MTDMTTETRALVERLRKLSGDLIDANMDMRLPPGSVDPAEAAAVITAQAETIAAMRAALEPFAEVADYYDPQEGDDRMVAWNHDFTIGSLRRARAALTPP